MSKTKRDISFEPQYIGQSVKRVEDPELLTGRVQLTGDLSFPDMLHVALARSPHAHARIVSIDVSAALKVPGVERILTGAEIKEHVTPLMGFREGFQGYALAVGKVRYVGEPVVAVAAISRAVAEDAVDLIRVEYEQLTPIVDPHKALEADAPRVWEEQDSNVLFKKTYTFGEPAAELARSEVVIKGSFRFPRVSANAQELNCCISRFDPLKGELNCWGGFQGMQLAQICVSPVFRMSPADVHAIGMAHGSAFGSRLHMQVKMITITGVLSKLCGGRHVRYIEDRMEYLIAGVVQTWDRHYEADFGFSRDGVCTAMRFRLLNDSGASSEGQSPTQCIKPLVVLAGPYRTRYADYELTAVVTNKSPEGTYRGYGPPPHVLVLERMMDKAAAQLGLDPAEIRRRNLIQPDAFPYTSCIHQTYDSGNYPLVLETALEKSGYAALRREQERLRAEGRLVGLGVVFGLEPGGAWGMAGAYLDFGTFAGGLPMPESAKVLIDMSGVITVDLFFSLEGQGQYTFASQLIADYFGVPMAAVRVRQSDARNRPPTYGPGGSRLAAVLPYALLGAADGLRDKMAAVAARLLQAQPEDLELREGAFRLKAKPEASMTLAQIAGVMAFKPQLLPPGIDGSCEFTYTWNRPNHSPDDPRGSPYLTMANACHVVWLEIDRETGKVTIRKYVVVDDCGTRLNPAVVEGMVQGGLAQGVGCVLLEEHIYSDDGQPLVGSYMDYLIPTIYEVPMSEKYSVCTPSPFTAFGQKGTGEGAIHTAPAAVFCAVNDALAPLGVEITRAPASPKRLWELIRQA